MPKVSVIMNCYNSAQFLKEAIDSVYEQTYQDWEIIFWDNQSADNSADIAKSYDERLRYFYADEFLPLGAARNKALQQVQGEYIAFLDCDDEWTADKLARQVRIFEEQKDVGFIYSNYWVYNTRLNTKIHFKEVSQPQGNILESQCLDYTVGLLTAAFRAALLSKLDEWFDPNLDLAEEYELFLRMFTVTQASYINEPLGVYRVHGENTSLTKRDIMFQESRYIARKLDALYGAEIPAVQHAMQLLLDKTDIEEAKYCFMKGDMQKTVELLAKHRDTNREAGIICFLTRLPIKPAQIMYKGLAFVKHNLFRPRHKSTS